MSEREAGWAVRDSRGIQVRTVSPTRRAAMANWLVTMIGMRVTNDWRDTDIEKTFLIHAPRYGARLVEVIIEEKPE